MRDPTRLTATLNDLKEQLTDAEADAKEAQAEVVRLRRAVEALEDVIARKPIAGVGVVVLDLDPQSPVVIAQPTVTNGERPPLRTAVITLLRASGNRGWYLTELADELWSRKWLGGEKKPSKETLGMRTSFFSSSR